MRPNEIVMLYRIPKVRSITLPLAAGLVNGPMSISAAGGVGADFISCPARNYAKSGGLKTL